MVSHLRDLVQQGRLLFPTFKEISSCTAISRPANGGKTKRASALVLGRSLAVFNHLNCCRVTFRCATLSVFAFGLSALWMEFLMNSASALHTLRTVVPALHFSAINCNYPLFSYHLEVSLLSCVFKPRSFC